MSIRSDEHGVPVLAVIGGEHAPCEVVVARSLGRHRLSESAPSAAGVGPVDFAAAMRRVEAEVYDAV
jgi:hypothetical protein